MSPASSDLYRCLAPTQDHIAANPSSSADQHASGRQPPTTAATAAELASAKISLYGALRRFANFPVPGISFIDIMPLFLDPQIHTNLLRCLELEALHFSNTTDKPDIVVGLDARGFLFGPSLALRLDAAFVPVRKKGKLPGPCVTASYEKEYGADYFQIQEDAIKPGQKVLVVDDIIATGMCTWGPCGLPVRPVPASAADTKQGDPRLRPASLFVSWAATCSAICSFSRSLSSRVAISSAGNPWSHC